MTHWLKRKGKLKYMYFRGNEICVLAQRQVVLQWIEMEKMRFSSSFRLGASAPCIIHVLLYMYFGVKEEIGKIFPKKSRSFYNQMFVFCIEIKGSFLISGPLPCMIDVFLLFRSVRFIAKR